MKKLTGWVCLVASSIWCFLMIPVVFVAAIVKFDALFIPSESSGFIYYGSILLGITLNILMYDTRARPNSIVENPKKLKNNNTKKTTKQSQIRWTQPCPLGCGGSWRRRFGAAHPRSRGCIAGLDMAGDGERDMVGPCVRSGEAGE